MRFNVIKKEQNNCSICSLFASSTLLHQFFTSNSVVFGDGGVRIFLAPGFPRIPQGSAGFPSYATGFISIIQGGTALDFHT